MGESEPVWLIRHVHGARAPIVARRVDPGCRRRFAPADCAEAQPRDATAAIASRRSDMVRGRRM